MVTSYANEARIRDEAREQIRAVPTVESRDERRQRQIRFSDLKVIGQSPAHYHHRMTTESPKKRAMSVGTVAHAMLLGGERVEVYEGKRDARVKAWQEFEAAHADAVIVSPSEYAAAHGCAEAVRNHREAMALLEGEHEVELPEWDFAGRACGGRPDVVHPQRIVELKTTACADPFRFPRHATKMAYHAQLAWYLDGHASNGGQATDAWIVAVEQAPPHVVTVFQLRDRVLEFGRRLYVGWVETLRNCEDSGVWPGYSACAVPLDAPDDDVEYTFADEPADAAQ